MKVILEADVDDLSSALEVALWFHEEGEYPKETHYSANRKVKWVCSETKAGTITVKQEKQA